MSRIIKKAENWADWGPIEEGTTVVDDYREAVQYDGQTWYSAGREMDFGTSALDYPVQIVWVPSDRDMLTWPEDPDE